MSAFKSYPVMKDSGVPWLGEVPEHWELPRLGALLRERGEINDDGHVSEVLSVLRDRGVIPYSEKGNIGNKKSEDISRYKVVRPDDIVVNCMNVIIGSVGLSRYMGCLSPVYYVLTRRSKDDDPRYLNAYFQTKPFQESLVRIGNGILAHRMRIPMELLKCEPFPRPPAEEQAAIVRFLDYMDRRIRGYIRAKQTLIKLLEEQKQAIIHCAVTRGLDPNVRLKPSGMEWLGDVPEHWEVLRLKEVITPIEQGWSPQCDAQPASDDEWGVLKVGCVNRDAFDERQNKKLPSALEPVPALEIQDGDILMSRANTRELLGLAALAIKPRPKLILCDKLFRFRAKCEQADSCFLVYTIRQRTSRAQMESSTNGASDSMQNIGQAVVRNLWLSLPPVHEQQQIVAKLKEQTSSLAAGISRVQQEIALLREYRTRLIADVVTGKLDVRDVAARLPDEAEEPEPLDEAEALSGADEDAAEDLDAASEEDEA